MSMTDLIKGAVIFSLGVAAGLAISWKYNKDKYETIAREEISDVKERYRSKREHTEKETDIEESDEDAEEELVSGFKNEYENMMRNLGYKDYGEKKGEDEVAKPYVIKPEEFGQTDDDYDLISLNYYADGVLTDDFDDIIEDVEGTVGEDPLSHFGEYENDTVYVRNDARKVDYEICLDNRKFSEVVDIPPHLRED